MKNKDKIKIKLIYYLRKLLKGEMPQKKIHQILYNEVFCVCNEEFYIKRLLNTINYLLDNFCQTFTKHSIEQIYFLICNIKLNEHITNEIVRLYYENIDSSAYSLAAIIHLYIVKNVDKYNIEFAFMVSNYIMLKKGKGFLIPYDFSHSQYNDAILSLNTSSLILVFFNIEYNTNDKIPCNFKKTEIIRLIKDNENKLKSLFLVKKLYLFGSFAKGTNNESSDIDFLVILDESLINIERLEQISLLKEFLSELFKCSVDVLDFTFALKELGENEMEHIITLI